MAPVEREGELAGGGRQQGIADRGPVRRVRDPLAGRERAPRVVEGDGLDREHLDAWAHRFEREAAARDQAAAAAGDQGGVGRGAECRRLLGELEPGRALPGDDLRVVVGFDEGRAGALRQLGADRLAQLPLAVVGPDLRAQRPGALELDRRGVGRHHDGRGLAERLRGGGDPLGVVARGIGDDRARRDLADGVVGAPELERAGPLQRIRP